MNKKTIVIQGSELYHFGVKGQQWGKRQYQYEDGSLTPEGREHYGYGPARAKYESAKGQYKMAKAKYLYKNAEASNYSRKYPITQFTDKYKKNISNTIYKDLEKSEKDMRELKALMKEAKKEYKNSEEYKQAKEDTAKKVAIAGAAIVGTALTVYGSYNLSKGIKDLANEDAKKQGKEMVNNFLKDKNTSLNSIIEGLGYKDNKLTSGYSNLAFRTGKNAAYQFNSDGIKYVGDSAAKVYKDTVSKAYKNNLKNPIGLIARNIKNN